MHGPFQHSPVRKSGAVLLFGAMLVLAVAAITGLNTTEFNTLRFKPADPILTSDNSIRASAPVTEDTPGPIITNSGLPGGEIASEPPLADQDR